MGIGIRELLLLLGLFVVIVPTLIWLVVRLVRGASSKGNPTAADRLAELESLRRAGQITTDEYEKQRATIISRI